MGNCFKNSTTWGRILGFCDLRIVQNGGLHNVGADLEYCRDVPIGIARLIESRAVQPTYVFERRAA